MLKQFLQPELVKKKLPREKEEVVESPRDEDVLRVPEPSRDMQLAIRNRLDKEKLGILLPWLNVIDHDQGFIHFVDAVLHLAKYDKHRIEVEAKCEAKERREKRDLAALQKKRYSLDREEKRRRDKARETQDMKDLKAWKKNLEVTRSRLKRELMFELGEREKRG